MPLHCPHCMSFSIKQSNPRMYRNFPIAPNIECVHFTFFFKKGILSLKGFLSKEGPGISSR